MNRIWMVVIDEPKPNTRTVLVSGKDSAPPIEGNGAITYVCGKCAFPIVENVNLDRISDIVFKCPSCGSFNDWSASASSHG
jgi:predicted RNA-binding Zn-ribbon protein involved in translation (DUF1610 family)